MEPSPTVDDEAPPHRGKLLVLFSLFALGALLASPLASADTGAAPEAPITEACGAATGKLCGTLNPGASAKVSFYFAYKAGSSCLNGKKTGVSEELEGQAIAVSRQLAGLAPATQYTYCLVAVNQFGETFGQGLSFATAPEPEPDPEPEPEPEPDPVQPLEPDPKADPDPGGPSEDAAGHSVEATGSPSIPTQPSIALPLPVGNDSHSNLVRELKRCRKATGEAEKRCKKRVRAKYRRARYSGNG